MTYEGWLQQVKEGLMSIDMPMEEWQSVWPFNFSRQHRAGTSPADTAGMANRYCWHQQKKSMAHDCDKLPPAGCHEDNQRDCQPNYEPGDHIKVEFESENGIPGE